MFQKYEYLLLFDTETTGLDEKSNEIIEFGGLLLKKEDGRFKLEKEIDFFIKNNSPIPPFIENLTHINDKMCENGLTKEEFFNEMKCFFKDSKEILLIAYNTPFDMKFIKSFMKSQDENYKISNDTLDLLEVAKDRTRLYKGNKLCDIIKRYNIVEFENSHRAIDDIKATLEVMRAMYKEKNDLEEYIRFGE